MQQENFKGYPTSIAELRSDKTGRGADWTPRDALVHLLRGIDEGRVEADALVILFALTAEDGSKSIGYRSATRDVHETLGLLEHGKLHLYQDALK